MLVPVDGGPKQGKFSAVLVRFWAELPRRVRVMVTPEPFFREADESVVIVTAGVREPPVG